MLIYILIKIKLICIVNVQKILSHVFSCYSVFLNLYLDKYHISLNLNVKVNE